MHRLIFRIFASVILFLSVLFMPWWISIILGLAGMIYFHYFVEAVALFLLSDLLFGLPQSNFFNMVFISASLSTVSMFVVEFIKKKLRFYN